MFNLYTVVWIRYIPLITYDLLTVTNALRKSAEFGALTRSVASSHFSPPCPTPSKILGISQRSGCDSREFLCNHCYS